MKSLPCGCIPVAEWCAHAALMQDALENAVTAAAVAITPKQVVDARRRFTRAQHELHEHLREAA